jgi:hypothetical protein
MDGVEFLPTRGGGGHYLGTRRDGETRRLVYAEGPRDACREIALSEAVEVPEGAKILTALATVNSNGLMVAIAGGPLFQIERDTGAITHLGTCRPALYAIVCDGLTLVVVDGEPSAPGAIVNLFTCRSNTKRWIWAPAGSLEIEYRPGQAAIHYGHSAVLLGPAADELGTVHVVGLLPGAGGTVQAGELGSLGPDVALVGSLFRRGDEHFHLHNITDGLAALAERLDSAPDRTATGAAPAAPSITVSSTTVSSSPEAGTAAPTPPAATEGPRIWTDADDWFTSHIWHMEFAFRSEPSAGQRADLARALEAWAQESEGLFEVSRAPLWWSGRWLLVGLEHLEFELDDVGERDALMELPSLVHALSRVLPVAEAVFLETTAHGDKDIPSDGPSHPDTELTYLFEESDGTFDRGRDETLSPYAADPQVEHARREAARAKPAPATAQEASAAPQAPIGPQTASGLRFDEAPPELEPQQVACDPKVRAQSLTTTWARPMPNGAFFALLAQGAGYTPALVDQGGLRKLDLGVRPIWRFSWSPDASWLYLGRDETPLMVNTRTYEVATLPDQPGRMLDIALTKAGALVHYQDGEGFGLALYRDVDESWTLVHRTACPKLECLLGSETTDVVMAVLANPAKDIQVSDPGCLIHVGEDGLRLLGCSKFRPQELWDDGGKLRWMSRDTDLDMVCDFATDGTRLWLRTRRGLLVTPTGLDGAIADALTRPPMADLGSVDRAQYRADTSVAVGNTVGFYGS